MGESQAPPPTHACSRGRGAVTAQPFVGRLSPFPPAYGRFISAESVVLAVTVHMAHLPERGASTTASGAFSSAGGGFSLLSVAAAQGVETCLAAPLGTGPNSFLVRRQLAAANIQTLTDVLVGDIGVSIVCVEEDASNTSVRTPGVETEPTLASLDAIQLRGGDVVHIGGRDLSFPQSQAIVEWGASLQPDVRLVVSISPAVQDIDAQVWLDLLPRADVVTMNIREASYLSRELDQAVPGTGVRHVMRPDAALVRRLGVVGCEVQLSAGQEAVSLPAFPSYRLDTTGVGDTHIGAMCAGMLQGLDLVSACQRANAAAALMVARDNPQWIPTPTDIDQVLRDGRVPEP